VAPVIQAGIKVPLFLRLDREMLMLVEEVRPDAFELLALSRLGRLSFPRLVKRTIVGVIRTPEAIKRQKGENRLTER
jgi:hypothetical protein